MLKLNGQKVELRSFLDGTLCLRQAPPAKYANIDWRYENDGELFALYSLTRHLQKFGLKVNLFMPYIPHARMDRVKNDEDVLTLKYFAECINTMSFNKVRVLDPHSSVSEALINNIVIDNPNEYIHSVISEITSENDDNLMVFYPDVGAMKRYSDAAKLPYTFGVKNRDWKTGQYLGFKIIGDQSLIGGKNVLIIDDICSKGDTVLHAAKALKACGAKDIYFFVTHCENTILKNKVLTSEFIKKVYTTDSIFNGEHEKIEIFKLS